MVPDSLSRRVQPLLPAPPPRRRPGSPGESGVSTGGFRPVGLQVTAFVVRDGKVTALYDVFNPEKQTKVEF